MENKKNQELRSAMKTRKVFIWEIADRLGIHETTLIKKLRKQLTPEQTKKIFSIIEELHLEKIKENEV